MLSSTAREPSLSSISPSTVFSNMAFAWITVATIASLSPGGVDAATSPPSHTTSPYANFTRPGLQLTTDANCTCFRTNSSTANYFSHHSFFDFRSMGQYVHTPAVLQDSQANINAPATNAFFQSTAWTNMWQAQNWDNGAFMKANNSDVTGSDATLFMVNSPNNIYIEHNSDVLGSSGVATRDTPTYMVMRTARLNTFQTSAEIESSSTGYRFVSVRMYARTIGAPGAITAMFTYRPGANNALNLVQESDLEIRTRDPTTRVQFTNQPSWNADGDIPQATRNVTMPGGNRWNDWAHYRMDWTPGATSWYVDGELASTITFQAPRDASQVMFNSWSDGGTWSGNMSANAAAFLQIQWIEMVFNNTDAAYMPKPGGCTNMCSIDETPVTGTPVLITSGGQLEQGGNNGGNRGGGQSGSGGQTGAGGSTGNGGNSGGNRGGSGSRGGSGNRGGGQSGSGGSTGNGGNNGNNGGNRGGGNSGNNGNNGNSGNSGGNTGHYQNCQSAKYGQCAGKTWNGCGSCGGGTTCKFQNDYYSQCL